MDFGLIKTRQFWNAALSASARGLDNFVVSNAWNNLNITYLVISRNEIGYGMKRPGPCELMRANYWLKCQLLLSLHCHPMSCHLGRFFGFDYVWWNCPVILWYFFFFTSFLVYFVVLTYMEVIWRISALVKCFSHATHFDKLLIISISIYQSKYSNLSSWLLILICRFYTIIPFRYQLYHYQSWI